jgi:hypothetical protein
LAWLSALGCSGARTDEIALAAQRAHRDASDTQVDPVEELDAQPDDAPSEDALADAGIVLEDALPDAGTVLLDDAANAAMSMDAEADLRAVDSASDAAEPALPGRLRIMNLTGVIGTTSFATQQPSPFPALRLCLRALDDPARSVGPWTVNAVMNGTPTTGYLPVAPGKYQALISPTSTGCDMPSASFEIEVPDQPRVTLLIAAPPGPGGVAAGAMVAHIFADEAFVAPGKAKLRLLNAYVDAGIDLGKVDDAGVFQPLIAHVALDHPGQGAGVDESGFVELDPVEKATFNGRDDLQHVVIRQDNVTLAPGSITTAVVRSAGQYIFCDDRTTHCRCLGGGSFDPCGVNAFP